jgi:glycerophosphoryl diester phosphodiesterase
MAGPVFERVPVVCGHRGSGRGVVRGRRENTLASFRAAVAAGVPWVEVDARLTLDDVLVARHDPILDDGRHVSELPVAETDAAGIRRVADLLDELPAWVGVDIDVKSRLEDALVAREQTTAAMVAALAERHAGRRPLLVSSFDASVLVITRELAPGLPVGLITWGAFPLRKAVPAAVHLSAAVVIVHVSAFGLESPRVAALERDPAVTIDVAHRAGLQVGLWGAGVGPARVLSRAGADFVVGDDDLLTAGLEG